MKSLAQAAVEANNVKHLIEMSREYTKTCKNELEEENIQQQPTEHK